MAAWSSGTTYAIDAEAQFAGSNWVSLQNGNLNHQPDVSPTWWINPLQVSKLTGYAAALPPFQLSKLTGYAAALPQLQVSKLVAYAAAFPELQVSKLTAMRCCCRTTGRRFSRRVIHDPRRKDPGEILGEGRSARAG